MKLDEAITTADHAQERLNLFLDAVPLPTAAQLADLSQAIWRLTAVRKTIYLIAIGKYSYKGAVPFPKGLKKNIQVLEEAVKLLCPLPLPRPSTSISARRGSASVPCGSSAPPLSTGLPSLGGGAPRLHLRRRAPQIPKPAPPDEPAPDQDPNSSGPLTDDSALRAPSSALESPPSALECQAPACPELRAPLSTAQAAARQADELCQQAGLPNPDLAPETSSRTSEISAPAPETAEPSACASAPATANGPSRGRRKLPRAKRSAARGNRSLYPRPSVGARSDVPIHNHDPPESPNIYPISLNISHFPPPHALFGGACCCTRSGNGGPKNDEKDYT
jgi:hypothetical protein